MEYTQEQDPSDPLEQRVITLFHESIEAKMHSGEALAPLISEASQMLVHALLGENKILTCGNGTSAALAQIFTSNLVNRFAQDRPSLPAITIGTDLTTQSSAAIQQSYHEAYARQIRALGQRGDLLLIVTSSGNPSNLLQSIRAAHDREMSVIALTGDDGGNIASLLDANDIELRVPVTSKARINEVHLLTLLCLCDLIDGQLFGGDY